MKKGICTPAILSVLLAGCTVGPVYESPEVDVPCEWHSEIPLGFNTTPLDDLVWWECLQDPVLNELMAYAANQNLDLKIAAIRVLRAREEANAKKADLYPRIDGSANYGHVYYSKDALINGLLGTALPVNPNHVQRNVNFYEIGFDAEWELDFFGLTAHEIAALKAHEEAAQESLCGVWVTLSAEIAKNYIELRGLQQRLAIKKNAIEAKAQALQLTQELLERQVISESAYSLAQAELSTLKGELPPLELSIALAIHRISILLGYSPGELFDCLAACSPLPELPCKISIGIPSELLRRRPDIRKAERELAAATERVGSAIAQLFPRFSLRGFIGDISTSAGSLFTPDSATWLAGPQMLVPIFNSRLIVQAIHYNKMVTQEAFYTYQKTVLDALEESENAIASYHFEEERLQHLIEAYQHNQKAVAFSEELYERGVHDNFEVTKAKESLLSSEDTAVQSHVALLLNYVSLYKALGGCWNESCQKEESQTIFDCY